MHHAIFFTSVSRPATVSRGDRAREALRTWPARQALGLLIIARQAAPELARQLRQPLAADRDRGDWWWLEPENTVAGDGLDPNYHWAVLREYRSAAAARACLARIREHAEADRVVVLLARPAPALVRRLFRLLQALLARLPMTLEPASPALPADWLGGVNPSAAQLERIRALPQDLPIGVLNLHRFHRQAPDPVSGETRSGRALGHRYMRRGLLTFSRLGGHICWSGAGLGQLHGPTEPDWQELALVWYPGRAAFEAMSRNRAFRAVIPYRKAGLSLAEVSMTRISASSRPAERRD